MMRNRLSLAILSPYRLPLDSHKIAVQSARTFGMAFVVVGALFTILTINQLTQGIIEIQGQQQLAAQAYSVFQTHHSHDNDGFTAGADNGLVNTDGHSGAGENLRTNSSPSPFSPPPSDVAVDKIDDEVSIDVVHKEGQQELHVEVYADDARKVEVVVIDQESGSEMEVTDADLVGVDRWKVFIDTDSYETGGYTVFAKVIARWGNVDTDRVNVDIQNDAYAEPEAELEVDLEIASTTPEELGVKEEEKELSQESEAWITIEYDESNLFKETVFLQVFTSPVTDVELYVEPVLSSIPQFIGRAFKMSISEWRLTWDTKNTPNGDYRLYAVATVNGEEVKSAHRRIQVSNGAEVVQEEEEEVVREEVASTEAQTESNAATATPIVKEIEKLQAEQLKDVVLKHDPEVQKVQEEIIALKEMIAIEEGKNEAVPFNDHLVVVPESEDSAGILPGDDVEETAKNLIDTYKVDIEQETGRLASAVRQGDQVQIDQAKKRLTDLRQTIIGDSITTGSEEFVARIDGMLEQKLRVIGDKVEKTEEIVKDRIGEAITKDTDGDGITDFDEKTIYGTDPEIADTDNDGFIDGAEILNGFDPKDASPEAIVAFESPKETGIERPDLLVVEKIARNTDLDTPDSDNSAAVISGKALPNSFVTLYVFSAPTVVTVKTDENGSWSYTFDKELEDGEHEIYVGVTDNAGKIVAKSEPLRFVKTAEAFTPAAEADEGDVVAVARLQPTKNLLGDEIVLLILSISIVVVGLVLIMLGIHLRTHRREHLVADGYQASPVA